MTDLMLPWICKSLSKYSTLAIEDLSSSWNDGIAFCAVLNTVSPNIIEVADLSPSDRDKNISLVGDETSNVVAVEVPEINSFKAMPSQESDNAAQADESPVVAEHAFQKAEEFLGYPPTADTAEDILSESEVTEEVVSAFLYAFSDSLPQTLGQFAAAIEAEEGEKPVLPIPPESPGIGGESALSGSESSFQELKKLAGNTESDLSRSLSPSPAASHLQSRNLSPSPVTRQLEDTEGEEEQSLQSGKEASEESDSSTCTSKQDSASISVPQVSSPETSGMESSQESSGDAVVDTVVASGSPDMATESNVSAADTQPEPDNLEPPAESDLVMATSAPIVDEAEPAGDSVSSAATPAGDSVSSTAEPVGDSAGSAAKPAGDSVSSAAKPAGDSVSSTAEPVGDSAASAAKPAGDSVSSAAELAGDSAGSAAKPAGDSVSSTAEPVGDSAGSAATPAGDSVPSAAEPVGDSVSSTAEPVGDSISSTAEPAGDSVSSAAEPVGDSAGSAAKPAGDSVSSAAEPAGDSAGSAGKPAGDSVSSAAELAGDSAADAAKPAGDSAVSAAEPAGDSVARAAKPATSGSDSRSTSRPASATPSAPAGDIAVGEQQSDASSAPRKPVVDEVASSEESRVPSLKKKKAPAPPKPAPPKPPSGPDGTIRPQPNIAPGSCNMCGEAVFEMERQEAEGILIHRRCLRCHVCKKILQEQSYEIMNNRFTCQQHYRQMRRRLKSSDSVSNESGLTGAQPTLPPEASAPSIKEEVQKLKDELNIRAGSIKRKRTAPLPPSATAPSVPPAVLPYRSTPSPGGSPLLSHRPTGSGTSSPASSVKNPKKRAPLPPSNLTGAKPPVSRSASQPVVQQQRCKPKAPPPPAVRQRHSQRVINEETLSLGEIDRKLSELDVQQQVLEEVAAQLENVMSEDKDSALNEKLMIKMDVLKSKKASLVSEENYLVYLRMDMELVKERSDLEAAMRELMEKDASQKTEEDQARELAIVDEIVALVEERNRLLESLECDDEEQAATAAPSSGTKASSYTAASTPKVDKKAQKEEAKRLEKEKKLKDKQDKQEFKERKEREKQALKEQKSKEKRDQKAKAKEPVQRTDSANVRFFVES